MELRDVVGYEEKYKISTTGDVISLSRPIFKRHRNGKISKTIKKDLVMKPYVSDWGYKIITLFTGGKYKQYAVHKLVAEAFIPNPRNLTEVNHIDGNKQNNNISNLEWCTHMENVHHAHRTGLGNPPYGERCAQHKLTLEQVQEILDDKTTMKNALAKKYGVHHNTIYHIQSGKRWAVALRDKKIA